MTSIGKPSAARASRRNCGAFFATRSALVPTARTALARQAAQALADALERLQRARLRGAVDALFRGQARAQAHHLAQRVERVDLAVDDAAHLQVEAVGAEVDRGEQVGAGHGTGSAYTLWITRQVAVLRRFIGLQRLSCRLV